MGLVRIGLVRLVNGSICSSSLIILSMVNLREIANKKHNRLFRNSLVQTAEQLTLEHDCWPRFQTDGTRESQRAYEELAYCPEQA